MFILIALNGLSSANGKGHRPEQPVALGVYTQRGSEQSELPPC